jgi:hypothetical protein
MLHEAQMLLLPSKGGIAEFYHVQPEQICLPSCDPLLAWHPERNAMTRCCCCLQVAVAAARIGY